MRRLGTPAIERSLMPAAIALAQLLAPIDGRLS
jgi:hypothetical protein